MRATCPAHLILFDLITLKLTNSMEQSPSWEADSHSASQEIPQPSSETEISLPCWKEPAFQLQDSV
jgi:hypothetical protein